MKIGVDLAYGEDAAVLVIWEEGAPVWISHPDLLKGLDLEGAEGVVELLLL